MAPRPDLQDLLVSLLGSDNVYFQPPPSLQMSYPCIVYERGRINTDFADDLPYNRRKQYQVTVIDRDADSLIPDKVGALATCVHERFFTANNLNHDVFRLFF